MRNKKLDFALSNLSLLSKSKLEKLLKISTQIKPKNFKFEN